MPRSFSSFLLPSLFSCREKRVGLGSATAAASNPDPERKKIAARHHLASRPNYAALPFFVVRYLGPSAAKSDKHHHQRRHCHILRTHLNAANCCRPIRQFNLFHSRDLEIPSAEKEGTAQVVSEPYCEGFIVLQHLKRRDLQRHDRTVDRDGLHHFPHST